MPKRPVALIILDGFGLRQEAFGNAVAQAHKPNFDRYWNRYPHASLIASGEAVGLPEGQMGNSEVGHLNIGAGRTVYQSLTRIGKSIREGDFFERPALVDAVAHVQTTGGRLHLLGLLSDGGVHSHIDHLEALLELAKRQGVADVQVHGFLDGRDVGPQTALGYVQRMEEAMARIGVGRFASISGRYYAMDRDKRWDRVARAYRALLGDVRSPLAPSAQRGIEEAYAQGTTDEFVEPFQVASADGSKNGIRSGDAAIFFNFRPDRAIELSLALVSDAFDGFDRGPRPTGVHLTTMTHYSDEVRAAVAFEADHLQRTLGECIAAAGKAQIRIAETEKYPHVTFFMSGGREEPFPGEERILIASPKVATYDLQPEMSAYEVTEALLDAIRDDRADGIILNFANPDMVGHSGMLAPTVRAIEAVDECLGRIVDQLLALGGEAIITADHGNSDEVLTLEGKPMTAHTTNPVPVIVTRDGAALRSGGTLADLAPTMLQLMGIPQPPEMTGHSLLEKEIAQ